MMQALGAQQSESMVQVASRERHGGWQRRSRQVLGAQQSESITQVAPEAGQGCQTR